MIGIVIGFLCDSIAELRCKESQSGSGYTGSLSTSASMTQCEAWSSTPDYLRGQLWWSQDLEIVQENIPAMGNKCRNPDNDPNGPWCFTHADRGQMEYCDIPPCGNAEFLFEIF